jgi:hypothetical protein
MTDLFRISLLMTLSIILMGISIVDALRLRPNFTLRQPISESTLVDTKIDKDSKCLFYRDPPVRKVVKNYLKNKLFGEDTPGCTVGRNKYELLSLLQLVIPPSTEEEIQFMIEEIMEKMADFMYVGDCRFSSIVLTNSIWHAVGDTIIQELIYLDCLQHNEDNINLLSGGCMEILKNSLREEDSMVVNFDAEDAKEVCSAVAYLNGLNTELEDVRDVKRRISSTVLKVLEREPSAEDLHFSLLGLVMSKLSFSSKGYAQASKCAELKEANENVL